MKRMRKSLFYLLIWVCLLSSCSDSAIVEKSFSFSNEKWDQRVKPTFVVPIQDTTKIYDFTLTVRTTTDYKYSNLWLFMNTKTPKGEMAREPFEIKTTYPDGTWIGKKTGTIVEHTLHFKRRKLPQKGNYIFKLEQGITKNVVDEVLDISLIVSESKTN